MHPIPGNTIKQVYTDHCSIILKLNILVREAKGPLNRYTVTKKYMKDIKKSCKC